MKQRIFVAILAGLLALQLTGCGGASSSSSSVSEPDMPASSSQPEPEPIPEPEQSSEEEPEQPSVEESPADPELSSAPDEPAIEELPALTEQPEAELVPASLLDAFPMGAGLQVTPLSAAPVAPAAPADTFKPFSLPRTGQYHLYAYKPAFMIYTDLGNAALSAESPKEDPLVQAIKAINAMKKAPVTPVNQDTMIDGGLLYVAADGTFDKHQYLLQGGLLVVDGTGYAVTEEQYAGLKKLIGEATGVNSAQWLVYMNPTRVVKIQCSDANGQMQTMKKENILIAAQEPGFVDVQTGSTYTPGAINFNSMFRTTFTFDKEGGITYTIAASGNNLYVESSDMSFACQYTADKKQIASFIATMQGMINGPANPRTM